MSRSAKRHNTLGISINVTSYTWIHLRNARRRREQIRILSAIPWSDLFRFPGVHVDFDYSTNEKPIHIYSIPLYIYTVWFSFLIVKSVNQRISTFHFILSFLAPVYFALFSFFPIYIHLISPLPFIRLMSFSLIIISWWVINFFFLSSFKYWLFLLLLLWLMMILCVHYFIIRKQFCSNNKNLFVSLDSYLYFDIN